jgi:hypothetical protein
MKFTDLLPGDRFEFDDDQHADAVRPRFEKVDAERVRIADSSKLLLRLDEPNPLVVHVGPAFESGRRLRCPGGEHFTWCRDDKATGAPVSLEDVISAGFANRLGDRLILPPVKSHPREGRVELAVPVRRVSENVIALCFSHNKARECLVRYTLEWQNNEGYEIEKRYRYTTQQPDGTEIEVGALLHRPMDRFLASEARFEQARTLEEHERDFVRARHAAVEDAHDDSPNP